MIDDDEPTVVKIDNGYVVVSKKTARMIEEVNTERRQHGESPARRQRKLSKQRSMTATSGSKRFLHATDNAS